MNAPSHHFVETNGIRMHYVEAGQVEPKEAYAKCIDKTGLVMAMKKADIDVSFAETDHDKAAPAPAAGPPAGGAHGAHPAPAAWHPGCHSTG